MNNEEKILSVLETLSSQVKVLVVKVDKLEQGVAKLEQGQAKLEQGQAKLEQEVAELKDNLRDVRERVILMENDNKQQIGVLFDSYSLLLDYIKQSNHDMGDIQVRQENQELNFRWLETRVLRKYPERFKPEAIAT